MFKLTSLNLNGIRSATSKGVEAWLEKAKPDCICVQEIKAQAADMAGRFETLAGLTGHFHFAEKKGYSGVGIYTRHEPTDVIIGYGSSEFDAEGRYVEVRLDSPARQQAPKLSIISAYFPSGSSGEERQAAKFRFLAEFFPYLLALKASGREFVLCGDINIAHQEIDLKNFKGNKKNSGFLPEERAWMTELLRRDTQDAVHDAVQSAEVANAAADALQTSPGGGLMDVYRHLHPATTDECYTWWSNRGQAYAKNVGWRLDYHLATPALGHLAQRAAIYKDEKFSDHAPVTVEYGLVV